MRIRPALPFVLLALVTAPAAAQDAPALHCVPQRPVESLAGRASPYDSVAFRVRGQDAMLCYGRPSARGRAVMGELVPYDRLWRTGANEPTTLHLSFPAHIAGIAVEPGSYSLYTVPGEATWEVIVNAATDQWGHESRYPTVEARELARATVPALVTPHHVEMFTISAVPSDDQAVDLVLTWEGTVVRIPVTVSPTFTEPPAPGR